jgi:putative ABC transport system ATP-binding protein
MFGDTQVGPQADAATTQDAPAGEQAGGEVEAGPVVAGRDIHKRFGEGDAAVNALRGVTVEFEPRTFSAIMGPSGSGKSTLMHILAGLDAPTEGEVSIAGTRLDGLKDKQLTLLRRKKVGFVFQSFNLLPVLTAEENIVLPLTIAGERPDKRWIERLLASFDLADRRKHRPSELSGGQQQRVAVARALAARPAVIFADEPTGNLDSAASEEVLRLLRQAVTEFGATIVMVTHDAAAASKADRILFLEDGEIVRDEGSLAFDEIFEILKALR